MDEDFIGGFHPQSPPSPGPPALPPKDYVYTQPGFSVGEPQQPQKKTSTSQLTHMSAVERSHMFRVPRMDPHLQVRGVLANFS